jgi:hypothetical protein
MKTLAALLQNSGSYLLQEGDLALEDRDLPLGDVAAT